MKQHGQLNTFPCGRCLSCLQQKRADWSFRLIQELAIAESAHFLTLTYSNETVPTNADGIPELRKKDLQLFTKRLRKLNKSKSDASIRYYAVGEYGTRTYRPHYHLIIYNVHPEIMAQCVNIWKHGNIQVGSVTAQSIHYTTKYVINRARDYGNVSKPFATMSRRPGLGHNYYVQMRSWHREDSRTYVVRDGGYKQRLPRYYKDKIFTSFERQMIALKLNKEIDKVYFDEIERLLKLHPDPCAYFDERLQHAERLQLQEMNSKNKF